MFYVFDRKPKCKTQVPLPLIFCSTPRTHIAQRGRLGFFTVSLSPHKKARASKQAWKTPPPPRRRNSHRRRKISRWCWPPMSTWAPKTSTSRWSVMSSRGAVMVGFSVSFSLFLFWVFVIVLYWFWLLVTVELIGCPILQYPCNILTLIHYW